MNLSIGERLRSERKRLGLNQADLGKAGGVQLLAQSNYENGKRTPSAEYLSAVAKQGVDVQYVLTGVRAIQLDSFSSADAVSIPVFDLEAAAGHGTPLDAENVIYTFPLPSEFLDENGLNVSQCIMLTIRGDSMEPTLFDGDVVLVDKSINKPDGVFLISSDGELRVKRVQRVAGGAYILISDNTRYREELIPPTALNTISLLGKCVLKISSVS
ncbi:XRE family transcriptional regulator [Zymobacter sp. IVIA_5232.4 C2]|uniref:XRE family transcriptional regulator n=1 Tax=Zymobacter sp. IVIA_5232.4 C2 TaxID=3394855 RepID=UPI0039C3F30C